jgi:excisionase family DNA binding protein
MAHPPSSGPTPGVDRRFLTLADVAEILATSVAQVRALVQSGELRYIQIGGRQQYRIETVELEDYIQRMYARAGTRTKHPDTGASHGVGENLSP